MLADQDFSRLFLRDFEDAGFLESTEHLPSATQTFFLGILGLS